MTREEEAVRILGKYIPAENTFYMCNSAEVIMALDIAVHAIKACEMEQSGGFINKSVIDDIKAEIESCKGKFYQNEDNTCSPYMEGTLNEVIKIIDKHI